MTSHPDPVDVHVGSRVRLRRTMLGLSQEKLGEGLGLTFQQIQKYERGANRIGSSRLYRISRLLEVPVSYFFEDMPAGVPDFVTGMAESEPAPYEGGSMTKRETLELVRAYYRITDPKVRKKVFDLVKAVAASSEIGTEQ